MFEGAPELFVVGGVYSDRGFSLFTRRRLGMNRPILVFAFVAAAGVSLMAQQASPSSQSQGGQYQGTSNPPPDETIITDADQAQPQAKPPAGHPMTTPPDAASQPSMAQPASAVAPPASVATGSNNGAVQPATANTLPPTSLPQDLTTGPAVASDPDGDIVHPAPLGPGMIGEGTMIRVRLLSDLSSSFSEQGQPFRSRVASDVLEGGNVVIPAGSEISGRVTEVSSGHFGGRGTLMLKPETVTLPDGHNFRLHAVVSGAPGTHTQVNNEGMITADSRKLRAGIEYAGAMGVGAVAGAYLGGPVGALAGTIVGAGVVTTHLLVSHPQAHLDSGDVLMLTVTERIHMDPVTNTGN
jgi:hypothetical protein